MQGTVDSADTTVVVGGLSTAPARQGRYWAADLPVGNGAGPWTGTVNVYAAKVGGANLLRHEAATAQLAKALQVFSYDDDGNLSSDGIWDFQYDSENRLVLMATTSVAASFGYLNRVLQFRYDYLGRRVMKRDDTVSGSERRFLYAGWNVIAEIDVSGTIKRTFTWGLDLTGSLSATGGVGALLQIRDEAQNKTLLPTYDGNGNVAALVNADSGALEAAYEYDPSGQLLRCEGAYAKDNPFRFSTKWQDDESGLSYYGHRYYSSAMGRFINRDPIAEQGGLNLYGFCGNDGINGIDILGNSWLSRFLDGARRVVHQVTRALLPIRALRSMDRRLERWENTHQQELKIAAAIVAAVVTYGAASEWAAAQINASIFESAYAAGTVADGVAAVAAASTTTGIMAGAFGGAVAGAVSGTIMTGTVKRALQGVVSGAVMGAVQGGYGRSFPIDRIPATAVAGGVASEIQGGSFKQGFNFSGAIAATTWADLWMRNVMVAQSKIDYNNSTDISDGFNGDGFKLGGGRIDPNYNIQDVRQISPLGGRQGDVGLIRIARWELSYAPGSFLDHVVESFTGPHDFFNSLWGYHSSGDYLPGASLFGQYRGSAAGGAAKVMNWIDVPLVSPLVGASVIGINSIAEPVLLHRGP